MLTHIQVPALNNGMGILPEVLYLAQPLKSPFVYIFSLPWYSHLYMKETVVHWDQFNRMKHSIGTRDAVGKLETFIPLLQSQLRFSFQQTKKGSQ